MKRNAPLATLLGTAALTLSLPFAGCVKEKGTAKKPIQIVAFDEHAETLQAIIDGEVYATVVQNPYLYGHESVRILARLAKRDRSALPEGGFMDITAREIRKDNVEAFWKELKDNLKAGEARAEAEGGEGKPTVAFVTNGVDPFWTIAEAGARAAAKKEDVNLLVRMPPDGVNDQKRMLEDLLVQEVDGVAVSPIDPANQGDLLNKVGDATHYLTHDSDAPETNRLAYIGMDNYTAGRICGKLVKEALPGGGTIMIFVGRLGQLNAEQRRQGLIDELLDRSIDPTRRDDNVEIKGDKYTILGTKTDDFDRAKAKANAQDAIAKYPDLDCMVGLFAYNPPLCLRAVKEAGRAPGGAGK